jgi:hypothetical protein
VRTHPEASSNGAAFSPRSLSAMMFRSGMDDAFVGGVLCTFSGTILAEGCSRAQATTFAGLFLR